MGSALVYKVNGFKNSNENQKNESRLCHSIPVALCRIEPEAERLYTRIMLVVVIVGNMQFDDDYMNIRTQ